MTSEKEPIGVIGVGWVGLVTATCFAELGHRVVARDILADKVESLSRGEITIHEPGLAELIAKNAERLTFTTDIRETLDAARLLFVCVDTPPTYSGDADLSRVQSVVDEFDDDDEHALVMKSTVPVGTGRTITRDLQRIAYLSCPEFLKEGTAVRDFMHPDRVVIGADAGSEWAADAVAAIYEPLGGELVRTDVASGEMIKLASNAFLATKISFINEIANVCEEVGADVAEVATGMGLDERIGPKFLQAGIGYGGSCFSGDETALVRRNGGTWLWSMREMFELIAEEQDVDSANEVLLHSEDLEVLSWEDGARAPEFRPVDCLTRRDYEGPMVHVETKMGRRVSVTIDHPLIVANAEGRNRRVKLAGELTDEDWMPVAQGLPANPPPRSQTSHVLAGYHAHELEASDVIVRPAAREIERVGAMGSEERSAALAHPRGVGARTGDILRAGTMRLDELGRLGLSLKGASVGTARNGTYVPADLDLTDPRFWRVAGLYLAEGHISVDGRRERLLWSFHPTGEAELVKEVAGFWRGLGVKATVMEMPTTTAVSVSSRVLAGWWTDALAAGRNCYEKRVPDQAWTRDERCKRALVSGMWAGDGSWSLVAGGPSVVLEYGTVSRELADGLLRLLGELGVMASVRVGRTAKSTVDTYWLRISGADQIEGLLDLVGASDHPGIRASIARQEKRIAPTGYRRHDDNAAWVRVVSAKPVPFSGSVYSLEVPGTHTVVTTMGLVAHQCFPKDVSALKQLAGNSGYHFQLLNSVIEVNELQKRRVVGKLIKHLGPLVGKRIALLGLAFKPDTDDMREASSLVLATRLQGEGASVVAWDPVAEPTARELLPTIDYAETIEAALEGSDGAVVVTEWPQLREVDWAAAGGRMATPLLVDGRNLLDAERVRAAGLTYEGIGRATSDAPAGDEPAATDRVGT